MKVTKIKDKLNKEKEQEEAIAKAVTEEKAEEVEKKDKTVEVKETPVVEEKTEEKTDEKSSEKVEETEEVVETTEVPVETVEEKVEEKTDEESSETVEKTEEKIEETQKACGKKKSKTSKKIKSILRTVKALDVKMEKVLESLAKVSVPAEGASEIVETPKEEEKVEAEKIDKVDSEVEKSQDKSSGESAKLLETIEKLQDRIKKLEDLPAPSKVVLSKNFISEEQTEESELQKIEDRLSEIQQIRKSDPQKYQKQNLVDEAFSLIEKKRELSK